MRTSLGHHPATRDLLMYNTSSTWEDHGGYPSPVHGDRVLENGSVGFDAAPCWSESHV
jgi:hypothetical protein